MSEYNTDAVDWNRVKRKLREADSALRSAESEIENGFQNTGNLPALANENQDIPHDVNELIKGVTNSSSYLRNGTMNYIPE